jgi:thymidine phosphorylase
MDTREIGLAVVDLGAGRRVASDTIDAAVGLSDVLALGTRVRAGEPLLRVHARTLAQAQAAADRIRAALSIGEHEVAPAPVVIERLGSGPVRRRHS